MNISFRLIFLNVPTSTLVCISHTVDSSLSNLYIIIKTAKVQTFKMAKIEVITFGTSTINFWSFNKALIQVLSARIIFVLHQR